VASRVRLPLVLLAVAVAYGVVGYRILEGFSLIDSFYMTVTTLSTVGFGEVHPLSPAGRVFTMTLILFGVLAVFDLIAVFTAMLTGGQLGRFLERRTMQHQIRALQDHYVICAYGRVGRAAAQELTQQGATLVVIESKAELEPLLIDADLPYIRGDATQESVLEEAGIRRAKALLCAMDSDAVNVYITLTARALNPQLFIISRASSPESVDTLIRAGSDRVVSPYMVSGVRMARMALQPAVLEFVDMVNMAPDLRIEELLVAEGSSLAARAIRDVCAPYTGVMVLAVRNRLGGLLVPPRADTVLEEGDVLIAVGPAEALARFAKEAT
jgi:voltage-gated potassium channel